MPLDRRFHRFVAPLLSPARGTELMAPFIYALVRSTRPARVLEVGAGYTTLFALQALADNIGDETAELELVSRGQGDPRGRSATARRRQLPFALFEHYVTPYTPHMMTIDIGGPDKEPVATLLPAARRLRLDRLLTCVSADFRGYSRRIDASILPFDLMFIDCGGPENWRDFMGEYWPLVNPAGGLFLVHSTLTNRQGIAFLNELKSRQAIDGKTEFELLSVLEPHKMRQNSFTILRKVSETKDVVYTSGP